MVSIGGSVEEVNGILMLRISLEGGGAELATFAEGIGKVEDGNLVIVLLPWLAKQLQISAGSQVNVDNEEGKLRITRADSD